jgi:hypothetical protein
MHSRYVRYVHQPSGAGPYDTLVFIWLAAPRGAADIYVSLCFWSYLTITDSASFGQSHLCHPFIYGPPVSPLLSRMPITKCVSSCKVNSSTSAGLVEALFLFGFVVVVVGGAAAVAACVAFSHIPNFLSAGCGGGLLYWCWWWRLVWMADVRSGRVASC